MAEERGRRAAVMALRIVAVVVAVVVATGAGEEGTKEEKAETMAVVVRDRAARSCLMNT
jgi:hypothetical protein